MGGSKNVVLGGQELRWWKGIGGAVEGWGLFFSVVQTGRRSRWAAGDKRKSAAQGVRRQSQGRLGRARTVKAGCGAERTTHKHFRLQRRGGGAMGWVCRQHQLGMCSWWGSRGQREEASRETSTSISGAKGLRLRWPQLKRRGWATRVAGASGKAVNSNRHHTAANCAVVHRVDGRVSHVFRGEAHYAKAS